MSARLAILAAASLVMASPAFALDTPKECRSTIDFEPTGSDVDT